jgi:GntR family transcriptional regulator
MISEFHSRPRDEATEKIEYYIIENKLSPNAKLPSERDMCKMWNFNRTTLRSAIERLIAQGKLYHRKGSGTFVSRPKLVRNLQDLKPFSQLVRESGKELETQVISACVMESNKEITKMMHLPLGHKIYELTRLRIVDGEPLIIETCYVDFKRFPELMHHDFSRESFYGVLENYHGVKIVNGEEKIGITYTTPEESNYLNLEEQSPVFLLTGVVNDEANVPIEYFKSVVRADSVRFASVLTR